MSTQRPRLLYASFDRFPAAKGAAVHIRAFVSAIAARFGGLDLATLPPEPEPGRRPSLAAESVAGENGLRHCRMPALGPNLIERVLCFRHHLSAWLRDRRFDLAHVRSIYEGYPLAREKERVCERLVVEINGLPSIELKYHYPEAADDRDLLRKLRAQEDALLAAADRIITVSETNAAYLRERGAAANKIVVIPNGVELDVFSYRPWRPREMTPTAPLRVLYAGTLAAWQGVQVAIEAAALLARDVPVALTLVGPSRPRQRRAAEELCGELGLGDRVRILDPVDQPTLAGLYHDADTIIAPLLANDRNCVQGCCPLKVLDAMASGTPLVASDLPVVADLARYDREAILVRPGSAKALKDGLLRIVRESDAAAAMAVAARRRVEAWFPWERAQRRLLEVYEELLGSSRATSRVSAASSRPG